ncbi:MAG: hypothetical protein RLZ50_1176 [Bacteroidota bacterium]|jgi:hypothetical protein
MTTLTKKEPLFLPNTVINICGKNTQVFDY